MKEGKSPWGHITVIPNCHTARRAKVCYKRTWIPNSAFIFRCKELQNIAATPAALPSLSLSLSLSLSHTHTHTHTHTPGKLVHECALVSVVPTSITQPPNEHILKTPLQFPIHPSSLCLTSTVDPSQSPVNVIS